MKKLRNIYLPTFIIVKFDTGTNLPAVSWNTLLDVAMMNIRHRWNGIAVPTQSHPNAASLTLSACKISQLIFQVFWSVLFDSWDLKWIFVISIALILCRWMAASNWIVLNCFLHVQWLRTFFSPPWIIIMYYFLDLNYNVVSSLLKNDTEYPFRL